MRLDSGLLVLALCRNLAMDQKGPGRRKLEPSFFMESRRINDL